MLARLTSKNQLTLPKAVIAAVEAAEHFDVADAPGYHVEFRVLNLREVQFDCRGTPGSARGSSALLRDSRHLRPSRPRVLGCRDPFHRPCLELALAGRADTLVTGDSDYLLALADSFAVPIMTPAGLRERLPEEGSADAQ